MGVLHNDDSDLVALIWHNSITTSCRYDGLFRFLLALRRAQTALQQIWALLMQYRRRAEELRPVWELRMHMGFLIDNLQYYVQVLHIVINHY